MDNPGMPEIKSAVIVPVGEVIGLFVEFAVNITLPVASVKTNVLANWLIDPELVNLIELPYNHKSRNGLSFEPISNSLPIVGKILPVIVKSLLRSKLFVEYL